MGLITTILRLWSLIETLITVGGSIFTWVTTAIKNRKVKEEQAKVDEAAAEMKKANDVVDDSARLKAKAEAACKLEKAIDPSADCDAP